MDKQRLVDEKRFAEMQIQVRNSNDEMGFLDESMDTSMRMESKNQGNN